jgi:ketosteroid isomerase-like protein
MAEDMEQAKERVRAGYEAFSRGDYDESARFLHPDVEWNRVADFENPLAGRDAVRQNMEPDAWEKQRIEILGMEAFGESLLIDTVFHAEGRGSGIQIDQDGYHLWKMKDGLGLRFQFFQERDDAVRAAREEEGLSG